MKELLVRGASGIVFLALVFIPIFFDRDYGSNTFAFVLYFFSLVGTIELQRMKEKSNVIAGAAICTLAFLPVLANSLIQFFAPVPVRVLPEFINQDLIQVLLIIWIIAVLFFIVSIFREDIVPKLLNRSWLTSLIYPTLPFLLLALSLQISVKEDRLLLFLILLPIYINDTFAYLTGRLVGKRKMFPIVSPKKTWEGFIGGVAGAQIIMHIIVYSLLDNYDLRTASIVTIFSFAASILATFGDLFESKLKRTAGIKDSGKIIPGHGGVLDRVDAMLFVAPVLYVLLTLFL